MITLEIRAPETLTRVTVKFPRVDVSRGHAGMDRALSSAFETIISFSYLLSRSQRPSWSGYPSNPITSTTPRLRHIGYVAQYSPGECWIRDPADGESERVRCRDRCTASVYQKDDVLAERPYEQGEDGTGDRKRYWKMAEGFLQQRRSMRT